jgi:hypothetical protein
MVYIAQSHTTLADTVQGRGAKPLYSLWDGEKLGYIDARKRIYAPLYASAVVHADAFLELERLYRTNKACMLPLSASNQF